LTFDFQPGTPYDLNRVFQIGNGHLADAAVPILMKYMKPAGDCLRVTLKDNLQRADLSLRVTNTNVIFYFGVEHVLAACYPPVQVPFGALASFAEQAELQRLGPPFVIASCPTDSWVGSGHDRQGAPRVDLYHHRQKSCANTRPPRRRAG
jgi:hypothetical protein